MIESSQSEVITIFEDSSIDLPDHDRYIKDLNILSALIGRQNVLLSANGTLRIMHYVGFFQHGKTRIQILPKIYSKNDFEATHESMDFIYRLMSWSGFLKYKERDSQNISSSSADLLELFITFFIDGFIEIFQRRPFKSYNERIELQQFIKGKILVSETIRTSPMLRHRHVVKYDEFSTNNSLNQIFKAVMLQLIRKTNSSENKKKLTIGLTHLEDVDPIQITKHAFDRMKFDRLNTSFQPLFNLCKLFFNNNQPGMTGGYEKTFSFLVPLNRLFEQYVYSVLSHTTENGFVTHYHQHPVSLLAGDHEAVELEPDYLITKNDQVIAVLDAKYKSIFDAKGRIDISPGDVHQMCAYALGYNVDKLFLIYPKLKGSVRQETVLAKSFIQSGSRKLHLMILQVDVLASDLSMVAQNFSHSIIPLL